MDRTDVNYELPTIAKRFKAYIKKNSIDFKDDHVSLVLDFLCSA